MINKNRLNRFIFLLVLTILATKLFAQNNRRDFELRVYDTMNELVHNHTFDLNNIPVADSLYQESVKQESSKGKMYALRIKYYALRATTRFDEFNATTDEFVEIAKELGDTEAYFEAMSEKIEVCMNRDKYNESMQLVREMLKYAEENNSDSGLFESYLLYGEVYQSRTNYTTAIKYLNKSLEYVDPSDSISQCIAHIELAKSYIGLNHYGRAIEQANRALSMATYEVYKTVSEWVLLRAYFSAHDMDNFKKFYRVSSLSTSGKDGVLSGDMELQLRVMLLVAESKFDEARMVAKEIKNNRVQQSILTQTYYYQKDYKTAFDLQAAQMVRNDSVMEELQQEELSQYDAQLGNAQLKFEAEEAIMRQNKMLTSFTIVILALIIGGLVFWLYQHFQEKKRLLKSHEETRAALEKAEKANAMRLHFIQNMSHEIRTPLNIINGFAQVLCDPQLEAEGEEKQEIMNTISQNTNHLTQLLENIITLSDYDAGNNQVGHDRFHLQDLFHAIAGDLILNKDVQLVVDKTDIELNTDFPKLMDAILKLVDNATKFTEKGSIRLGGSQTEHEGFVRIFVEDTGKGIPADLAEKVFERFYKVDEFIPGIGLGLPLCRAIVTSLGGTVVVDTAYTQGTRVVMEFPENAVR